MGIFWYQAQSFGGSPYSRRKQIQQQQIQLQAYPSFVASRKFKLSSVCCQCSPEREAAFRGELYLNQYLQSFARTRMVQIGGFDIYNVHPSRQHSLHAGHVTLNMLCTIGKNGKNMNMYVYMVMQMLRMHVICINSQILFHLELFSPWSFQGRTKGISNGEVACREPVQFQSLKYKGRGKNAL